MYKNKLRSSNMAQPSLESCGVEPGDGFQYLSSYQNVSRWKNRNRWKKSQNYFFLTNFLMSYFKTLPEKLFSAKKTFFCFLSKYWIYSWNIIKPLFLGGKTSKSWPRNQILWLSDENSRKNSDYFKSSKGVYDFREAESIQRNK